MYMYKLFIHISKYVNIYISMYVCICINVFIHISREGSSQPSSLPQSSPTSACQLVNLVEILKRLLATQFSIQTDDNTYV